MNLHVLDWSIVLVLMVIVVGAALITRRYTRSVSDFLAANRSAGRYLLCVAGGASTLGAISIVARFEMYYAAGFTAFWWSLMMFPMSLIIALSGWVVYRYRETRAMTLAQFFEMRYSRKFRIFTGIVGWVAGIVNFGIFPAVSARFFIYFCGFPQTIPHTNIGTYPVTMIVLIAAALFFVFIGGQVTLMVTDFIQGLFTLIVFVILIGVIFWLFDWNQMMTAVRHAPPDQSLLNPFHGSSINGFNVFYFIIGGLAIIYKTMAWQGSQGFHCAAKSAHEAKMASILGEWRGLVLSMVYILLPIGAWMVMHGHIYPAATAHSQAVLKTIASPTIRQQMTVPIVLAHVLPIGAMGLLAATMLAAFLSTQGTYLHSWGSIFVQDVILPLRGRAFTTRQHIGILRVSIGFVAVFIFFFSLLFQQTDYILMFFAITSAIYLGGAGSAIIGGLYWKHGSTSGAWAAFLIGSGIAVGGVVAQEAWPKHLYPWLAAHTPAFLDWAGRVLTAASSAVPGLDWTLSPTKFPFNGQWVFFFAMLLAISSYLGLSLFEWLALCRPACDMDRLLHRGDYAVEGDHARNVHRPVTGWRAMLPTSEFTMGDKVIYWGKLLWTISWITVFVVGCTWNLLWPVSDAGWEIFWEWTIGITIVCGVGTTVWFLIGGLFDMKDLMRTLGNPNRDFADMGIVQHENITPATAPVGGDSQHRVEA